MKKKEKEFLSRLAEGCSGLFQLSIVGKGKTHTRFFKPHRFPDAAEAFSRAEGHVFFSPNPRTIPNGKDEAVGEYTGFFADYDSGDKEALKRKLREFPAPPTAVIFSGRGYHLYWLFKEPEKIDEDYFRGVQKGIALFLGADPTIHNPARLMRVPGSTNPKNGKRATVLYLGKREYNPSDFEEFYTPTARVKVEVAKIPETDRITAEEILALPVSRKTINRIIKGSLEGAPSRSERDMRIIRALLKVGVPPQKIIAVFLNPSFGCSDKVREKGKDGIRYLLFSLEKARRFKGEGFQGGKELRRTSALS